MQLKLIMEQKEEYDFPRVNIVASASESYLVESGNDLYKITPNYVTRVTPEKLSQEDSIDTVIMEPEIFSRSNDIPKMYREAMLFSAIRESEYRKTEHDPRKIKVLVEKDEVAYVDRFDDKEEFFHFRRQLRGYGYFLQKYYDMATERVLDFICNQLKGGYNEEKHQASTSTFGFYTGGFYDTSWRVGWMTDVIKESIATGIARNPNLRALYEKNGTLNTLGKGLLQKVRNYIKKDDRTAYSVARENLKRIKDLILKPRLVVMSEEDKEKGFGTLFYSIDGWTKVIGEGIQQGLDPLLSGTRRLVDVRKNLEMRRKGGGR